MKQENIFWEWSIFWCECKMNDDQTILCNQHTSPSWALSTLCAHDFLALLKYIGWWTTCHHLVIIDRIKFFYWYTCCAFAYVYIHRVWEAARARINLTLRSQTQLLMLRLVVTFIKVGCCANSLPYQIIENFEYVDARYSAGSLPLCITTWCQNKSTKLKATRWGLLYRCQEIQTVKWCIEVTHWH